MNIEATLLSFHLLALVAFILFVLFILVVLISIILDNIEEERSSCTFKNGKYELKNNKTKP